MRRRYLSWSKDVVDSLVSWYERRATRPSGDLMRSRLLKGHTVSLFHAYLRSYLTGAGGLESLDSYGSVLLVAGGIGITHPVAYLLEIVNRFASRSTAVRRVTLVWVVRSLGESTQKRSK